MSRPLAHFVCLPMDERAQWRRSVYSSMLTGGPAVAKFVTAKVSGTSWSAAAVISSLPSWPLDSGDATPFRRSPCEGGRGGRPMQPRARGPPACPPRRGSRARPTTPRAGRRRRCGSVRPRARSQLARDPTPLNPSAAWSDNEADAPPRCARPRAWASWTGPGPTARRSPCSRWKARRQRASRFGDGPRPPARPGSADVRVIAGRHLQGGLRAVQVRGAGLVGHVVDGEVAPAAGPVGAGLEAVQERHHALVCPAVGRGVAAAPASCVPVAAAGGR